MLAEVIADNPAADKTYRFELSASLSRFPLCRLNDR